MRRHLEQAVTLASRAGVAARCEAHARLALEAARLGARTKDEALLAVATEAAEQAKALAGSLPGHPPWRPQADAALAEIALAKGDVAAAVEAGAAAAQALRESQSEDVDLDVLLPASRAIFAGAPPEVQKEVRGFLELALSRITQGTVDDAIRVRWLRASHGRDLVELTGGLEKMEAAEAAAAAGAPEAAPAPAQPAADSLDGLEDLDRRIMHLLTEGQTNREMAETLGLSEADLATRLSRVLARLGASNRAEATSLAFRGLTPPPSFIAATGPN
jgi:DNA-binding NarL/FixJ family response regulator